MPDADAQKAVARDMQLQAFRDTPFVPLGQFMVPGVPLFTNIRKS